MIGAIAGLLVLIQPAVLGGQWSDPSGDTLITSTPPALDLTDVSVSFSPGEMTVCLAIDPAGITPQDVESAVAFIDFDIDLDSSTGRTTHIEDYQLWPAPLMGIDAYIVLYTRSRIAELFMVSSTGLETSLGLYDATVEGFTVSVTVPRCSGLGSVCLGARYGLAVLLGNEEGPTDRAPNGEIGLFAQPAPGDFDEDGDVDEADVAHMRSCQTGAQISQTNPGCLDAHLDGDADVDLDDFGILQENYTGSY